MRGEQGYKEFHGKNPKGISNVNFHVPKNLIVIGKAVAVEYKCDKLHGGGDGKMAVYRHEFETPAIVAMDEKMHGQLYIIGSKIKVTEAGIEN